MYRLCCARLGPHGSESTKLLTGLLLSYQGRLRDYVRFSMRLLRDGNDLLGDLSGGFSRLRLLGSTPPISASRAFLDMEGCLSTALGFGFLVMLLPSING
jgi:hypothetical protein